MRYREIIQETIDGNESQKIDYKLERSEHGWAVVATVNGEYIGSATIGRHRHWPDAYSVMDVWVNDDYRRRGVASAMYDFAYRNGFAPLYPDQKQSPAGSAFWHRTRERAIRLNKPMPPMEWGKLRGLRKPKRQAPVFEAAAEPAVPVKLYHITDNAKFKLDPNYAPEDNAFAMTDRSGHKGIYLARNVEHWVNGHGYIRPFVAEILADPSVLEHDRIGRWGGEIFVPADQFDKLRVNRVVPLDVIAREQYGQHGWIETSHGHEFDTGNEITAQGWEYPFRGWAYDRDVRDMSPEEIERIKQHFDVGYRARTGR